MCIACGLSDAILHQLLDPVPTVLGREVVASREHEASSRGATLLALEALGPLRDATTAPMLLGSSFTPAAGRHARYQDAIACQERLYRLLVHRAAEGRRAD